MKRPKEVKVGLFDVNVVWSDKAIDKIQRKEIAAGDMEEGETLFGRWHPSEMTIYVRSSGDEMVQRETFLHELLHCCIECSGIRLTKNEENTVRALSPTFLTVLSQNPKVAKFILGGSNG